MNITSYVRWQPTLIALSQFWSTMFSCGIADEPSIHRQTSQITAPTTFQSEPIELASSATILNIASKHDALFTVDADGKVQHYANPSVPAKLLFRLESEPSCASFTRDANWLAFADSDGVARLWQRETQQIERLPVPSSETVANLAFSNDGTQLACASRNGQVRIFEVASRKLRREFNTGTSSVQLLAFSPNGMLLAASSFTNEIHIAGTSLMPPRQVKPPAVRKLQMGSRLTALTMPSNKQIVAATTDGSIRLVPIDENHPPSTIAHHPCAVWTFAFDASRTRMAAGSWDGRIRVWNVKNWELLQTISGHQESVTDILFTDHFGLVSASLDNRLLNRPDDLPSLVPAATIDKRKDSVWVATRSPDQKRLFVGGREGRFELWNLESDSLINSRPGHPTTRCASFSADGNTLVTGGDDGRIFVCNGQTGKLQQTLNRHPGSLSALVLENNSKRLISACDSGLVKLWDLTTGKQVASWDEHKQQIYCAAISPDEKWLLTGGGNWTTGDPGELIVWDLTKQRLKTRLDGHKLAIWSIVFMPDGQRFASSDSSGAVKIWSMNSLEEERTLQHSTWVRPLAISPDGKLLAVGRGDGPIRLWNTKTWQEILTCNGNNSFAFHLQFDSTGRWLTSGGDDGTVQMWSIDPDHVF